MTRGKSTEYHINECYKSLVAAEAKRDRLREALQELVFLIDHDRYFYDGDEPTEMKRARKALQEDRDETGH